MAGSDKWSGSDAELGTSAYDVRSLGIAMLLVFVSLTVVSAVLIARIPYEPDLYNLIYGPIRPKKPENTYVFLLVFPAMIGLAALAPLLAPRAFVRKHLGAREDLFYFAFLLFCHTAGWGLAALARDRNVWLFYFG